MIWQVGGIIMMIVMMIKKVGGVVIRDEVLREAFKNYLADIFC